jgi:hypothetical protein
MPEVIESHIRVEAAGTKPKRIDEFVGRVNTDESRVSVAWCLPAFAPDTVHRDDSPPPPVTPGAEPPRGGTPWA